MSMLSSMRKRWSVTFFVWPASVGLAPRCLSLSLGGQFSEKRLLIDFSAAAGTVTADAAYGLRLERNVVVELFNLCRDRLPVSQFESALIVLGGISLTRITSFC